MFRPTCERCGRPATWYRMALARGWAVTARCDTCNASAVRNRAFWPLRNFDADEIAAMPIRGAEWHGACAVCGEMGALEAHHLAPRHLFRANDRSRHDAESWPVVQVCGECHMVWHSLVTPNMTNAGGCHE